MSISHESLQELAKARAHLDSKNLKKVINQFYRLVSADISGEQLQAAHESFLLTLDQLRLHLSKANTLRRVTELEVSGYEREALAIEGEQQETKEKLTVLAERLTDAQRDRARTIQYDAIAKSIGKLPARSQGLESKARLSADIELLKEEQQTYGATWDSRKQAFDDLVVRLVSLSDSIKEEKMEQERLRMMDEDDTEPTEDAAGLDPTAKSFEPSSKSMELDGQTTGQTTPVGPGGDEDVLMDGTETEEGLVEEGMVLEEGQEREEKEEGEED